MSDKSMMLITSKQWDPSKPFRLMPISKTCSFTEGIYDADAKLLVMISNIKKQNFHMVAKLDAQGDQMKLKTQRTGHNPKPYPEERKLVESYQEHYITEKSEIEEVIKMLAVNADTFNYAEYLEKAIVEPEKPKFILQP